MIDTNDDLSPLETIENNILVDIFDDATNVVAQGRVIIVTNFIHYFYYYGFNVL